MSAQESGRERSELLKEISLAPFHYTVFGCSDLPPGARLVFSFSELGSIGSRSLTSVVDKLRGLTCRAQGPIEILYITVQEYIEANARAERADQLWLSPEEEKKLDE
jgi:hypothetical protein